MLRALVLATLFVASVVPRAALGQQAVRLNIRVVLVDADGVMTPVPRHALLISDSPPSAAPRRIVTASDGTGGISLRPGRYIVESDQPVAFHGQAYRWIEAVDVVAEDDPILELTVDNARVGPITASALPLTATDGNTESEPDASALLLRWEKSVVGIWTPTSHASGFVVDQRGLVATSRQLIGSATSVEVQFTPTMKVAGTVVAADSTRSVALIRVDPGAIEPPPASQGATSDWPSVCELQAEPLVDDQEVLAIGVPLHGRPDLRFGTVRRVTARSLRADFGLRNLSPGGPVLAPDGGVVGITSVAVDDDGRLRDDSPIVLLDQACAAIRSAEGLLRETAPPDGAHLPVEPATAIPKDELEDAASTRLGSLAPDTMSSSDFDITFITPLQVYGALYQAGQPTMDFSNWNDYVRDVPPVLLIRVTPQQSESFWMKLARGAARTQGTALPPIMRFGSGFARLRAFCGDAEVTPIHPFKLELRVSETEGVREGLSVFAPDALGPDCGTVRLMLYSDEEPDKADTLEVDPGVLQRIREDFALFRSKD